MVSSKQHCINSVTDVCSFADSTCHWCLQLFMRVRCVCVPYPSFWPVELFKNILEILHGSVCYQHDGLVTQAALAQRCSLNTHAHTQSAFIAGNAVYC